MACVITVTVCDCIVYLQNTFSTLEEARMNILECPICVESYPIDEVILIYTQYYIPV